MTNLHEIFAQISNLNIFCNIVSEVTIYLLMVVSLSDKALFYEHLDNIFIRLFSL